MFLTYFIMCISTSTMTKKRRNAKFCPCALLQFDTYIHNTYMMRLATEWKKKPITEKSNKLSHRIIVGLDFASITLE